VLGTSCGTASGRIPPVPGPHEHPGIETHGRASQDGGAVSAVDGSEGRSGARDAVDRERDRDREHLLTPVLAARPELSACAPWQRCAPRAAQDMVDREAAKPRLPTAPGHQGIARRLTDALGTWWGRLHLTINWLNPPALDATEAFGDTATADHPMTCVGRPRLSGLRWLGTLGRPLRCRVRTELR
jgi:hypothetical protein